MGRISRVSPHNERIHARGYFNWLQMACWICVDVLQVFRSNKAQQTKEARKNWATVQQVRHIQDPILFYQSNDDEITTSNHGLQSWMSSECHQFLNRIEILSFFAVTIVIHKSLNLNGTPRSSEFRVSVNRIVIINEKSTGKQGTPVHKSNPNMQISSKLPSAPKRASNFGKPWCLEHLFEF